MAERVVVLGGGACGMTAAHALARRGADVTVLEREARPGGLCGTHQRGGFRFDLGGHRFISRSAALHALAGELLGDALLLQERRSVVLHGGARYHYPLQLDDVLRHVGLARGARILGSFLGERLRNTLFRGPETTFEQWVTHRFGAAIYGDFFGPYTEKLWGIPPSEISADWAAERISLLSLTDVAIRLLGLRRGGARTYARRYLYPRLGIGQIFERMAEETTRLGGRVHLGARVTAIDLHRGHARAVRFHHEGREREIACDRVISTIALPLLARMLGGPSLPREIERSAARLRFRGIRLLNVLLDLPEVSPNTWMYVSEPGYRMARIQEPKRRSPHMAPDGKTSLVLEIPCDPGDAVWSAPEEALWERCMDDLSRLGFCDLRRATLDHFSTYVAEGYPIYHLDHRRDRDAVLSFVGATPNLISCGRQGGFRYVFMDAAMEMGLAAAAATSGGERAARAIAALGSDEGGLLEARALTA